MKGTRRTKTMTRKMVGYALKHVPSGLWWTGREWARGKANAKVYRTWRQADRANDARRRELAARGQSWHVAECEVYA
jgi:hypothetical protein